MTPFLDGYQMGYLAPLTERHADALVLVLRNELPARDLLTVMQDVYESGELVQLPRRFWHLGQYLADIKLITIQGRPLH